MDCGLLTTGEYSCGIIYDLLSAKKASPFHAPDAPRPPRLSQGPVPDQRQQVLSVPAGRGLQAGPDVVLATDTGAEDLPRLLAVVIHTFRGCTKRFKFFSKV